MVVVWSNERFSFFFFLVWWGELPLGPGSGGCQPRRGVWFIKGLGEGPGPRGLVLGLSGW